MKKASFLLLPSLAVVVLLWLPYGFQMGGLIEEWGLLALYSQHGPFFIAGAHSVMPQHQMRPFMTTLWALAYTVDPDSWWFWHAELALSLLIKGASLTWLAFYLSGSRRLAVIAGLLLVVWPADSMQMAFRALNIGMSCALIVLSAALLIAAYLAESRGRRMVLSWFAVACIVVGSWMYELTLLLAPLPFMILYARNGFSGMWTAIRARTDVTLMWLAGCSVCVIYIVKVLLTAKVTYQQAVAGDEQHVISTLTANAPMLFSRGLVRSLLDGWLDAARIAVEDLVRPGYLVLLVAVFVVIVATNRSLERAEGKQIARIALIGTVALVLGYSPFLISLVHLSTTQRTFMFAAPGSALIFLALLMILERIQSLVAIVTSVVLLVLGTIQQLYQFDAYNKLYDTQRIALRSIVAQLKNVPSNKTVVVLDDSQRLNGTWMLDSLVPSALTYLTGTPVQSAMVCLTPQNIWETRDGMGRQGSCVETADSWIFKWANPVSGPGGPLPAPIPDIVISKADAVVVRVPRETNESGQPLLTGHESTLNPSTWPVKLNLFDSDALPTSYHWDFGHRWDIPKAPNAGTGWRGPEWDYKPFHQTSVSWISLPRASLLFDLYPQKKDYELVVKTLTHADSVKGKIRISVNGAQLPVQWVGENDLHAAIPAGILKSGSNTLEFESPAVNDYYGVSLCVDRIDLDPVN